MPLLHSLGGQPHACYNSSCAGHRSAKNIVARHVSRCGTSDNDLTSTASTSTAAPSGANPGTPPYLSFLTFLQAVEWLSSQMQPGRLDSSLWQKKFSGTSSGQLVAAFRFLRLTDGSVPTEALVRLTSAPPEQRPALLLKVLGAAYGTVRFDRLGDATPVILREWLRAYGLSGATHRKAVSFLVNALKYSGQPMSPAIARSARNRGPVGVGRTVGHKSSLASGSATPISGPRAQAGDHVQRNIQPRQVSGHNVRTVSLASGGTVSVSLDVDLFGLSPEDQEFVLRLVGLVREYGKSHPAAPAGSQPTTSTGLPQAAPAA